MVSPQTITIKDEDPVHLEEELNSQGRSGWRVSDFGIEHHFKRVRDYPPNPRFQDLQLPPDFITAELNIVVVTLIKTTSKWGYRVLGGRDIFTINQTVDGLRRSGWIVEGPKIARVRTNMNKPELGEIEMPVYILLHSV